ncbi:MAG: AAA family ATPase [Methylococcales bacterium]
MSRPITHRILGERDIAELLEWNPSSPTGTGTPNGSAIPEPAVPPGTPVSVTPSKPEVERPVQINLFDQPSAPTRPSDGSGNLSGIGSSSSGFPEKPTTQTFSSIDEEWPPAINALGIIGQYQAVEILVKQALFSKATGVRFSDKLLVGPAGVGKSTLAHKIGETLLNRESLFFNGSDLRRPVDLLERLTQEGLVPDATGTGLVLVDPALIFIDEVHGISTSVATVLLSAMDDRRVTSIDNTLYDFSRVVFLLATTDQGKLSEAFQSRPNKTWLRPYTLHEQAGIFWLHGKESLDGAELSRDCCYEIAARARCNPRRSVRDLTERLRPHFFFLASQRIDGTPSIRDAAALMTAESIAEFYEEHNIDYNGLDNLAIRFLKYLKRHGVASEATLKQALGLTHPQDFIEVAEYLVRLGLIETSSAGRRLTRDGTRYLSSNPPPDLRGRISRAMWSGMFLLEGTAKPKTVT